MSDYTNRLVEVLPVYILGPWGLRVLVHVVSNKRLERGIFLGMRGSNKR